MRASQLYSPTLREMPADAEVMSHKLMLRAGFIRKLSAGLYTFLPLAWRMLRKIETIVREEMDVIGSQEIMMPIIQPAEIWQQSGRWGAYGEEMFRLQDRHQREFCLGPTHEEMITTLVKMDVSSYKQLPLTLYQIQNKYRDEVRPRFGLMRSREFIMKDGYSFDADPASMKVSYQKMYDAYSRIFTRCGLDFRPVEADSGAIGGSGSHEFMAFAKSGEAAVVRCHDCDYAANIEVACPQTPDIESEAAGVELEKVATPHQKTIEALCQFLQIDAAQTIKVVMYQAEKKLVMAVVPGTAEVNDVRVAGLVGAVELPLAGDEELQSHGLVPGYLSPIGLTPSDDLEIIVDPQVMQMTDAVSGANEADTHFRHVIPQRDFPDVRVETIRLITDEDVCPKCGGHITIDRGIEVGQVFQLGTKYSESLGAMFLDQNGKSHPFYMGCYGIGVSRTMAATIEQSYDDDGIIWPVAIAPYQVVVVAANSKNEEQQQAAEQLYNELTRAGIETVFDDRKERAGIKFKDADLIGYPVRVTVGKTFIEDGEVEIKVRRSGEVTKVKSDKALSTVQDLLASLA